MLRVLIEYIVLSDEDDMVVSEVTQTLDVVDIFSVDYIEESETRVDLTMSSRSEKDTKILPGNKRELKQKTAELLVAYMDIFRNEKDTIDVTYEDIQDRIFKLKEREKDMVTDRLKAMTDEGRDVDTILKISKLAGTENDYSKGLKKGLTVYDKDFYEEEQKMRDELEKAERKIRKKNRDATDENIDILVDEYMEQWQIAQEIDDDAYGMEYLNETYYDGNFDGVDAPEEDYDDYADFDS